VIGFEGEDSVLKGGSSICIGLMKNSCFETGDEVGESIGGGGA